MSVPGSEEGTPQSFQDRVPSTVPASGMEIPTVTPTGNLFVEVADQAWDAVVPVRESGFVETDIARDDSDAPEKDTKSVNVDLDQPEMPRMKTQVF